MKTFSPFIVQTQKMLASTGINMTLKQVYQELLKDNFINPDCTPTKWALENGYLEEEFNYPQGIKPDNSEDATSDADLDAVLSKIPPSAFRYINEEQGYAIEIQPLSDAIIQALIKHELSPDGAKKWQKVLKEAEKQAK